MLSLSTTMTEKLNEWHDLQLTYRHYFDTKHKISAYLQLGVMTTSLLGAALIAVVETVAYGVLTGLSKLFASLNDRPYRFFGRLLQTSLLTTAWAPHSFFKLFTIAQGRLLGCTYFEADSYGPSWYPKFQP